MGCAILAASAALGEPAWTYDASFSPNLLWFSQGTVALALPSSVVRLADGKCIAANAGNLFDGTILGPTGNIVRLNADGSFDSTFPLHRIDPGEGVNTLYLQPDGHLVAVGNFATGTVVRFNPDGTRDASFSLPTGKSILAEDGATGDLYVAATSGSVQNNSFMRCLPNGAPDPTFSFGTQGYVSSVFPLPGGRSIVTIGIPSINNPVTITRLLADGSVDSSFKPPGDAGSNSSVCALPDGSVMLVRSTYGLSDFPTPMTFAHYDPASGVRDYLYYTSDSDPTVILGVLFDRLVAVGGAELTYRLGSTVIDITSDGKALISGSSSLPFWPIFFRMRRTAPAGASVPLAPTIATQPKGVAVSLGGSATLSVQPYGLDPFSFQWQLNGVDIPGATQTFLHLSNIQSANLGTYRVVVTNAEGSVTSTDAVVGLSGGAPVVLSGPTSQTANVGDTVSFSVTSADADETFQWLFNGAPIVEDGQSSSLVLLSVQAAQAGAYSVIVSSAQGSATSPAAILAVNPATPPVLCLQPKDETVAAGTQAQFMVEYYSVGGTPFTYQWLKNGVPIAGQTDFRLTIPSAQSSDAGSYAVVLTSPGGSTTSRSGLLTVQTTTSAPTISVQPQSQTVTASADTDVLFSVTAAGNPAPTYQWCFNGTPINYATNSWYTLIGVGPARAGTYTVTVTNSLGSVTSAPAVLTVRVPPPSITTQPSAQTVAVGGTATFAVSATAWDALAYQWYKNGEAIAGASGATLTLANLQRSDNGAIISVVVTDASGCVTSNPATLTVQASRLVNMSGRAYVGTGSQVLVVGYVVGGSGSKQSLIRAVGPALSQYGVAGLLADPKLDLYDGSDSIIGSNVGWANPPTNGPSKVAGAIRAATTAIFDQVYAFALPSPSPDSALVATLPAAAYTAQVGGVGGATGVALAELYDIDAGTSSSRFINMSARAYVGTGSQVLVAGFVISGPVPETVLIRAVGPALSPLGVDGVLAAPQLDLYDGNVTIIASDTGWCTAPVKGPSTVAATVQAATAATFSQVYAFPLPTGSADCALIVTLPPGAYTAQVSGVGGTTGVALVEVYELF